MIDKELVIEFGKSIGYKVREEYDKDIQEIVYKGSTGLRYIVAVDFQGLDFKIDLRKLKFIAFGWLEVNKVGIRPILDGKDRYIAEQYSTDLKTIIYSECAPNQLEVIMKLAIKIQDDRLKEMFKFVIDKI